ncbi:MAG: tRNA (N(6)-L-threonylcarbamoyladenosine(37)-C(2))-methylthiotransferase MtaB [Anaerolineae bacterium]|nr:MAG: MiaB-like tRNA modifying enzyme [Chloroflexi bacterium OLB13]MBW7879422.1 tRNA (N(6)-L-threonylcarbamoyladenosine(37)-C(2))-methylthiotransferase MtaB [Anaerolineae bacterium]
MTGCRLNQAELDAMARQFAAQGHEIVREAGDADWHVVNTCAVTTHAAASSRKLIRELHRAQPDAQITVTGCYAQIAPEAVAKIGGVVRVVDNLGKDTLVEQLTGQPAMPFDAEPVAREAIPGRTRAFVKVQDGCDNACTFCITTVARGAGRSRPLEEVVAEVRALHTMGYQEAVLTGVHLGSYGHDHGSPDGLRDLVSALLAGTEIPRLRLSSLEPWDLDPAFFALWADEPRLCRHLHLPLQSGCDRTLKRMLRRTSQVSFAALVEAARTAAPDMAITTDVIAGFPGETDDEFNESTAFIEAMDFAGLHVFPYSPRPGTAAARMKGQTPHDVRQRRAQQLLAYSAAQTEAFAARFSGHVRPVLWENVAGATQDGFLNVGYTDNYVRVRCTHPRALTGMITPARLGLGQLRTYATAVPILEG